jgi:hypothetical protein
MKFGSRPAALIVDCDFAPREPEEDAEDREMAKTIIARYQGRFHTALERASFFFVRGAAKFSARGKFPSSNNFRTRRLIQTAGRCSDSRPKGWKEASGRSWGSAPGA